MQAVILAGGLGTRLWPLTKEVPKPMVPVAGAPYLEHQLRLLAKQSITDIVLLTGYLGEQVEAHFGDGASLGLSIRYSREPSPLGTGGALRLAKEFLADAFLVIYGDSYLPIDYRLPLQTLLASEAGTGLLVLFQDAAGETTVQPNVALSPAGLVTRYEKDSRNAELQFVEAGVLALRRRILADIPEEGVVSLEKEVFPKLIQRGQLLGWPTSQRFYDIGTPERLRTIEGLFA